MPDYRGKIITFYSYKGGTGRSMALANVAWILACGGKRVLAIDWDLEAPGLYRYFSPYLADRDLTASEGIIDFALKFADAAIAINQPQNDAAAKSKDWQKSYANILRYAVSLKYDFPRQGTLDLIPAGRQGDSYATRVNSFDWAKFYERLGGARLLELARLQMLEEYDYILIDSRTGVGDTAGICTITMPDTLVVCFTLNNQSIEGSLAVTKSVLEEISRRDDRPNFQILPVPMRLEIAEKTKLDKRLRAAQEGFSGILGPQLQKLVKQLETEKLSKLKAQQVLDEDINKRVITERDPLSAVARFFEQVAIQYVPYYAYAEVPAPFASAPNALDPLLTSLEALTSYITNDTVNKLTPLPEEKRLAGLQEFEEPKLKPAVQPLEQFVPKSWWSIWLDRAKWAALLVGVAGIIVSVLVPGPTPQPQPSFRLSQTFDPQSGPIVAAAVSSDNQDCYTAVATLVQRWNCADGKPVNSWQFRDVNGMVASPEGKGVLVWTATLDQNVFLLLPGKEPVRIKLRSEAGRMFPTAHQVLWPNAGTIMVVDDSGVEVGNLGGEGPSGIRSWHLALGPRLFIGSDCAVDRNMTKMICLGTVNLEMYSFHGTDITSSLSSPYKSHASSSVSISPQGDKVATDLDPGQIAMLNGLTLNRVATFSFPSQSDASFPNATPAKVTSVAFSPDGKLLAAARIQATSNIVAVWNTETKQLRQSFSHKGTVYSIAFSADGKLLITASGDGTSQLWAIESPHP